MCFRKKFKQHFRIHKKNGHPSLIYDEYGNEYKYIGITHAPITHGLNNELLKVNPNRKDKRKSYARPFSTHDIKNNFKKIPLKGYKVRYRNKKIFNRIKKNYVQ